MAINKLLQTKILKMMKIDQKLIKNQDKNFHKINKVHTNLMKKIIFQYGWPGKNLVNEDGTQGAWLLVQHSDHDLKFQKKCLSLIKDAANKGEIELSYVAYLTDRVLKNSNKSQLFGTQFYLNKNKIFTHWPIRDKKNLNKRRKIYGLPPLKEYNKIMKYNQIYKNNNVWGNKPNELLQKIYKQLSTDLEFLDLGCGQGRDSLFMLQKGFKVTAIDNSQEDIKKIKEFIQTNSLPLSNINLFCKDIKSFNIKKNKYAIINIFNSLQFLPKKEAIKLIYKIKKTIKNKGYIIISGFTVSDPLYKKMNNGNRCFFKPQELKKLFSDFNIIFYEEKIILDKGHYGSSEPHRHGIVKMIAQKNGEAVIGQQ